MGFAKMRAVKRTRAGGHRMPSRIAVVVAASAALAIGLSGCAGSGAAAPSDKTTIRFLHATGDETFTAVMTSVADAFNAQSDSTIVKLEPLPAGTDYATAMKTMDATGNWPAIVDMRDTATYIHAGKLAPIPKEVTDLLSPETYGAAADGNVYTVPTGALTGELGLNIIYNKDYFADHGLEVPTTYDEFITLMKDIKANGDTPLATAAVDIWPSDQLWKPLASQYFAKYTQNAGFWNTAAAGGASLEDLREPLTRLKYITDNFVLPGWQSTADAQTTTLLVNGQTVMATSSAGIGRLKDISNVAPKFNAGMFIIPSDDGTLNVLRNSVAGDAATGLAISAQAAADDKEYASSVEFLTYFYSVEAANLMEAAGGIAPQIKKADEIVRNDSIPGSADFFALLANPHLHWYENAPTSPDFTTFNTFFRQARIEMQDGQTTIDQAIEKSQAEFDSVVAGG